MKGYLAYKNNKVKKTHDLLELIKLCETYDSSFGELIDVGVFLNPFATQIRYPKNFYDITDVETKKALEFSKLIIDFVNERIDI
ncbi:MAG TPA: HEPN domain-containing protein [Mollicutes bacterium]|nr:HEPN domain-containing protein [Mollicutes bacterium]